MATPKKKVAPALGIQVDKIEAARGPVGPGHSNADRSANILAWLKNKKGK